jgi:hypothetical protein
MGMSVKTLIVKKSLAGPPVDPECLGTLFVECCVGGVRQDGWAQFKVAFEASATVQVEAYRGGERILGGMKSAWTDLSV